MNVFHRSTRCLTCWAISLAVGLLASCATTIKETVPLDYEFPNSDTERLGPSTREGYKPNEQFLLSYDPNAQINIDGLFTDWSEQASSIVTQISVFGQSYDPVDAEASLSALTDGSTIWFYLKVSDDKVSDNRRDLGSAWQDDSVDIYFSTRPGALRRELSYSEYLIRVVPQKVAEKNNVLVGINGREYDHAVQANLVYQDGGYQVEMAIPVVLLTEKKLQDGSKLQLSLQVNDADGNGRDRILHWINPNDTSWNNFSDWGRGMVYNYASHAKQDADEGSLYDSSTESSEDTEYAENSQDSE